MTGYGDTVWQPSWYSSDSSSSSRATCLRSAILLTSGHQCHHQWIGERNRIHIHRLSQLTAPLSYDHWPFCNLSSSWSLPYAVSQFSLNGVMVFLVSSSEDGERLVFRGRVRGERGDLGGALLAEVVALLLGLRGDELQGACYGLGDGRRGRQVGALGAEAVLVGDVAHGVLHAVRARVREGAVGYLRLQVLLSGVLQVALLLRRDAVARLVAEDTPNTALRDFDSSSGDGRALVEDMRRRRKSFYLRVRTIYGQEGATCLRCRLTPRRPGFQSRRGTLGFSRRKNAWAGETGYPRENPPTSGIVPHDSHLQKFWSKWPWFEPGSPWWKVSRLTAQPPRPHLQLRTSLYRSLIGSVVPLQIKLGAWFPYRSHWERDPLQISLGAWFPFRSHWERGSPSDLLQLVEFQPTDTTCSSLCDESGKTAGKLTAVIRTTFMTTKQGARAVDEAALQRGSSRGRWQQTSRQTPTVGESSAFLDAGGFSRPPRRAVATTLLAAGVRGGGMGGTTTGWFKGHCGIICERSSRPPALTFPSARPGTRVPPAKARTTSRGYAASAGPDRTFLPTRLAQLLHSRQQRSSCTSMLLACLVQ
ncbi:hypothetical protein PR048_013463 [Dryococelus australis]|uniref:Uncharacterized protein n=1 Tax=Dryococelus australis TaxID=614101 RepID=A0ABQ9HS88_9NEOP|nr:hypothetical protein PR048_013463 [Dryococelus australis]